MVGFAVVSVTVVVVILQEEVLVCAVGSESDGSDAETGKQALKAVPPAEGASIAPCLIASPGVALGPNGVGMGGSLELIDIEAGNVPRRHCGWIEE